MELSKNAEKNLMNLPAGMQAQILAEIQGNDAMKQRVLMLLEKGNTQRVILDDIYSAMQEMLEPGSAPHAKGAWPLTAARFRNEIQKQKSQEARSAGLAGLGQDYAALATALVGIAGPIVNAVVAANTSPRGNIPQAAAPAVAAATTGNYSDIIKKDIDTTPIQKPAETPAASGSASSGTSGGSGASADGGAGEKDSSKKWIIGGGVAVAAVGGIALLAILLTRKKKA